jgi:Kef-type K+ transport system membrane component KefB
MALPLLFDVGIIVLVSAVLAYAARFLRQPVILAYVVAGLIVGPVGLGIITNTEEISLLSELGIIFLLFSIGLELDFRRIENVGFATIIGGSVQMILTFAIGFLAATAFGLTGMLGIYIGLMMAISSTMIVAKVLTDKDELGTLHGRIMVGVLILQDIVAVIVLPMLSLYLSMPVISFDVIAWFALKGLGFFAFAFLVNKFLFPRVLDYAAQKHEILFITAVANCFLFIGLSYVLGFTIAIGGFIAGLSMANFPYNLEIEGEVHSLRDFFSILFFSSMGMQLNFLAIGNALPFFITVLLLLMFIKPAILAGTYLLLGYGGRTAAYIGLGLGQTSEFVFIIAAELLRVGSITQEFYSLLVSMVVISIVTTPYMISAKNIFYNFFSRFRIPMSHLIHPKSIRDMENPPDALSNHTVLFGAHMMGDKIIHYLKGRREKLVVVERDPEIVKNLRRRGIYVLYGDAENEEMLSKIFLDKAKLLVTTIPYADVTAFVVRKAKRINPKIRIFARAPDRREAERIYKAGADIVIIPEYVSGDRFVQKIDHFLKEKKL